MTTLAPMTPVRYRIADKRVDTADVVTLAMEPDDNAIDDPLPGQFSMLYAFGIGEVPISVSSCPAQDGVVGHTIREVGAATRALCALERGDAIGVRGPFGVGWPVEAAYGLDLLVVGGGIGLAPLRPVIRRAVIDRERFGRVAVIAGARTPGDLLYPGELASWPRSAGLEVSTTVDVASGGWEGDVGVVTTLLPRLGLEPDRTVAMLCGPEVMMRVAAEWLVGAGIEPACIYVSLERNMQCGIGHCGHCQLGPVFVCTDGPVFSWPLAAPLLQVSRL